jgi:prophage DNA circulation protein
LQTLTTGTYGNVESLQTLTTGTYGNVSSLQTLTEGTYGNVESLQTLTTGTYGNVESLQTLTESTYGNVSSLQTLTTGTYGNVESLQTLTTGTYGNVSSLQNLTEGISGDISAVTFNTETIFTRSAEIMTTTDDQNIDYNNGTTIYSTNTSGGPYTYTFTNVPDVSTNSHIFTVFTMAGADNYSNCYASGISVDGNPYTMMWNNGEDPTGTMADVVYNDVVTQQIALMPTSKFNGNIAIAISSVSFYKSAVVG